MLLMLHNYNNIMYIHTNVEKKTIIESLYYESINIYPERNHSLNLQAI